MYNYDDYDTEFEEFAAETGFLTNFSEWQLAAYQKALEMFPIDASCKELSKTVSMFISSGWKCEQGLYFSATEEFEGDLGPFWRLFERVQKEEAK